MLKTLRSVLCCLICCQLINTPQLWSQQSSGLKLAVLAGEGATNFIDKQQAVSPVVQVFDAQGEPLSGTPVTFRSPLTGPSVTFFGATHAVTLRTDAEGRAQAPNTLPNTYKGPFTIEVSASQGENTASAVINQSNLEQDVSPKKKKRIGGWVIVGIATVVTIVVVAIARRAGD